MLSSEAEYKEHTDPNVDDSLIVRSLSSTSSRQLYGSALAASMGLLGLCALTVSLTSANGQHLSSLHESMADASEEALAESPDQAFRADASSPPYPTRVKMDTIPGLESTKPYEYYTGAREYSNPLPLAQAGFLFPF